MAALATLLGFVSLGSGQRADIDGALAVAARSLQAQSERLAATSLVAGEPHALSALAWEEGRGCERAERMHYSAADGKYPMCVLTALSSAYIDGHEVFMRSLRAHRGLDSEWPLIVLHDRLTAAERSRVCALYTHTHLRRLPATVPDGIALSADPKWAANMRKLFALFALGRECESLVKIDSGDMLVMGDMRPVFAHATNGSGHVLAARALTYATNLNGGLIVFQRQTLSAEAYEQLVDLARASPKDGYREQWLLRKWLHPTVKRRAALARASSAVSPVFLELPKRYNVEHSFWGTRNAGPSASPSLAEVVGLHYVGEKPWMRRRKGPAALDAEWWRHFGKGRLIVVGEMARSQATTHAVGDGWVVDLFEHIARVTPSSQLLVGVRADLREADAGERNASASCELESVRADALRRCFARVRARGVFVTGLAAAEAAVVSRVWQASVRALGTHEASLLLDARVRVLGQMRQSSKVVQRPAPSGSAVRLRPLSANR